MEFVNFFLFDVFQSCTAAGARMLTADRKLSFHTLQDAGRVKDSSWGYYKSTVRQRIIYFDCSLIINADMHEITVRDMRR